MPKPTPEAQPNWPLLAAGAAVLFLAVFVVYSPALRGRFLWDDVLVVHRNPLVTGELAPGAIWFRMDFPLTYVAFWLEWLAWGNHPAGYHMVNVLLHATGALLLWRVLAQLKVPAPWLAAMIFAVHPVCVASVAWISELKNTLSLPFFLLSLLWYVQSDPEPRSTHHAPRVSTKYCLSILAFLLALLSKTSTVMLPVVLLACAWWQRGRITWRDWWRTSPFFALALAFGPLSIWFQAHGAILTASVQSENFWGRLAGAGMALWFYLGKALLPLHLCMIYPRWRIDAAAPLSHLPLLLWCSVLAACWPLRRTWGRHVLFGLGCFTVTLLPVLGFLDMYFLLLSRVSDHFAYLPLTALVALAAGGLGYVFSRIIQTAEGSTRKSLANSSARSAMSIAESRPGNQAPSGAACSSPPSRETSVPLPSEHENSPREPADYEHSAPDGTIPSAQGPGMSCLLGRVLCLVAGSALVVPLAVLAMQRAQVFQSEEALWRDTLAKNPAAWCAHANLGWILAEQHKYDEAREHLAASLEVNPDNAQAHSNLGRVLSLQGRFAEAQPEFQAAARIKPKDAEIRRSYASALAEQGRKEEAVKQLKELLELKPDTEARSQLATLLYQTAKYGEAVAEYRQVVTDKPDQPEALCNLAWLLATSPDSAVRNGTDAVRFAEQACRLTGYQRPQMIGALAAAYAEAGRFTDAIAETQKAIELCKASGDSRFGSVNEQLLSLYRAGKPYHMPPPK